METYDKPQETAAAEARDLEREHQTYINVCQAYEEAGKKRGKNHRRPQGRSRRDQRVELICRSSYFHS